MSLHGQQQLHTRSQLSHKLLRRLDWPTFAVSRHHSQYARPQRDDPSTSSSKEQITIMQNSIIAGIGAATLALTAIASTSHATTPLPLAALQAPSQSSVGPILDILKVHAKKKRHCHTKRTCRWVTKQFGGGGSSDGFTRRVRVCSRKCHSQ